MRGNVDNVDATGAVGQSRIEGKGVDPAPPDMPGSNAIQGVGLSLQLRLRPAVATVR
jgi:hypothetical protein